MTAARSLLWTLVTRVFLIYIVTFAIVSVFILADFRIGGVHLDRQSLLLKAEEVASVVQRRPDGSVEPNFSATDARLFMTAGAAYGMVVRSVPDRTVLFASPYRRLDIDSAVADEDDDGDAVLTGLDRQTGERLFGVRRQLDSPIGLIELELMRSPGDLFALFSTLIILWLQEGWPIFVVSLGLLLLAIFVTVRQTLAPIARLSEVASRIGADSLTQRLPLSRAPTELLPLVQATNLLLERLEAAFKAQRDFTANAAHELKTPLALAVTKLRSDAVEAADVITLLNDTGRMVNQLLNLAQIESGAVFQRESITLLPLVRAVTSDAAPSLIASGREIEFEGPAESPVVFGHAALVEIALRNLLENARLHTPPGARIRVAVHADGEITVEDNGPTIDATLAAALFAPFVRANRSAPGAGLGLSIIARIATALGGKSGLRQPAAGQSGNIFFLHLPLAERVPE